MLRRTAEIVLLTLFCAMTAVAQDPGDPVKEADAAFSRRDLPTAADLYRKAIEGGASHIDVFIKAARAYALMGKRDEAFLYLDKGVGTGQGLERIRYIGGNADFAPLQLDPRWTPLMKKYNEAWEPHLKPPISVNPLRFELYRMVAEDQIYRNLLIAWEKKHGIEKTGSEEYRSMMDEVKRIDAQNTAKL